MRDPLARCAGSQAKSQFFFPHPLQILVASNPRLFNEEGPFVVMGAHFPSNAGLVAIIPKVGFCHALQIRAIFGPDGQRADKHYNRMNLSGLSWIFWQGPTRRTDCDVSTCFFQRLMWSASFR
jgi:hypothetical protein